MGTEEERLAGIFELQPGHEFYATDSNTRYWYTGDAWVVKEGDIPLEGRGYAKDKPSPSGVPLGYVYWSVDTGTLEVSEGDTWRFLGEV